MLGIMAFAAEHPVLSHSEHRPVGDIERVAKEFEVVSEYQPAGDADSRVTGVAERAGRDTCGTESIESPSAAVSGAENPFAAV